MSQHLPSTVPKIVPVTTRPGTTQANSIQLRGNHLLLTNRSLPFIYAHPGPGTLSHEFDF